MPDRSRIFGKREKFISMSSKVLNRRKKSTLLLFGNGTLFIVVCREASDALEVKGRGKVPQDTLGLFAVCEVPKDVG